MGIIGWLKRWTGDATTVSRSHQPEINPATGLPLTSGIGSPDVGGNTYGTRSAGSDWHHETPSISSAGSTPTGAWSSTDSGSSWPSSSSSHWSGSSSSSGSMFDTWSQSSWSSSHDPFGNP